MDFLGKNRFSIYLGLIIWGFAVAMMHPGFAMMVTGTIMLFLIFVNRFVCHVEGQYMLRMALNNTGAQHDGHATRIVMRRLGVEFLWAFAIFLALSTGLFFLVKHIPWLWWPSPTN